VQDARHGPARHWGCHDGFAAADSGGTVRKHGKEQGVRRIPSSLAE